MLSSVRWADVVVLALHLKVRQGTGAELSRSQMQLAQAVIESGTPVVLALFGNPYAAMDLPEPDALLLAYDPSRRSATAALGVMMGRRPATGRLPVSIPGRYAMGSGAVVGMGTETSSSYLSGEYD